jgi:hypothetical protein
MCFSACSVATSFLWLLLLFILTAQNTARAEESVTVGAATVGPRGTFQVDNVSFSVIHFDDTWRTSDQATALRPAEGSTVSSAQLWTTEGPFAVKSSVVPFAFKQTLAKVGDAATRFTSSVFHPEGVATNAMCLAVSLPTSSLAGRSIRSDDTVVALPAQLAAQRVYSGRVKNDLEIPTAAGRLKIAGQFNYHVQDERRWQRDAFTLRIFFTSTQADLMKDGALDLEISYTAYASHPINLAPAANMGFHDEAADDQTGGWTDQGPSNDLRGISPGALTAGGVRFEIIDPVTNGGKSCLAFAVPDRPYLLKSATIPLADAPAFANLYLLHATAWTPVKNVPVATLMAVYVDGSSTRHEIVAHRDVDNWWQPEPVINAAVAWRGENKSSEIGLYVSRFAIERKPLKELRLEGNGQAVWLVAGISGSPDDIQLPIAIPNAPVVSAADDQWRPYEHKIDVIPGGPLDFSFLLDAPAGKYGPIRITPAGHFEFANRPGSRVRFWGTNICFSANFLAHEQADALADRLARSGYNSVRLHHYDEMLIRRGGKSYEFDAEQLDRLDYLFSALKNRGMYISIDLFTTRPFGVDEVPDLGETVRPSPFKALLPFSDAAFESWRKFARNLLTHKNPYTNLAWGEDPALVGICPVNEDTLFDIISGNPAIRKLYDERFQQWLTTNKIAPPAGAERTAAFNRFVTETQIRNDDRMRQFLHSIGVTVPLTGVNRRTTQAQAIIRARYDYVDDHGYWDHPSFPVNDWALPYKFHGKSVLGAAAEMPRRQMPGRIVGKPYTFTEFNYVYPNPYRAEGGPVMGAYAALQDWDAVYNFDFAHTQGTSTGIAPTGLFDANADPVARHADRISALLFLRGDVTAAPGFVPFAVSNQDAYMGPRASPVDFPDAYSRLGLITRVGSVTEASVAASPPGLSQQLGVRAVVASDPSARNLWPDLTAYAPADDLLLRLVKDKILPPAVIDVAQKRFRSETGQIELFTDQRLFKVVTDRSECFVLPANGKASGKFATVSNGSDGPAVIFLTALDDQPLSHSRRMLVLHLSDSQNTGGRFGNRDRTLIESFGSLPHLLRRGTATLSLTGAAPVELKASALDATGARIVDITPTAEGDAVIIPLSTLHIQGGCVAYELSRAVPASPAKAL